MTWLERLFEKIFYIFPRIWLVDVDEAGVRVTLGTRVKDTPPGWYFYWPVFQTAEKIKVKQQVVDLRPQSVRTLDGKELVVSGAIKYKVTDARKAILDVLDYDKNIQVLALGVIQQMISGLKLADIHADSLADYVLIALREELQGWGLKIQICYITDIGKTRNLRLLLNDSPFSKEVE